MRTIAGSSGDMNINMGLDKRPGLDMDYRGFVKTRRKRHSQRWVLASGRSVIRQQVHAEQSRQASYRAGDRRQILAGIGHSWNQGHSYHEGDAHLTQMLQIREDEGIVASRIAPMHGGIDQLQVVVHEVALGGDTVDRRRLRIS